MGKLIDLTGQRFGRLTVIERAGNTHKGIASWECICDCGFQTTVRGDKLRSGHTISCGCYKGTRDVKHGHSHTRIYNIWAAMKQRCYNPNTKHYGKYGGRGIIVCDEWIHDFQAFWDWAMANGYRNNLSIDRIDNDKGYSPENCRWVTQKEQTNNCSRNRKITIGEQTLNLTQWCEKLSIKPNIVDSRLRRGWTSKEALGIVPRKKK